MIPVVQSLNRWIRFKFSPSWNSLKCCQCDFYAPSNGNKFYTYCFQTVQAETYYWPRFHRQRPYWTPAVASDFEEQRSQNHACVINLTIYRILVANQKPLWFIIIDQETFLIVNERPPPHQKRMDFFGRLGFYKY